MALIMDLADRLKLFGLEGRSEEIRALAPVVAASLPSAIEQWLRQHRQDERFGVHLRLLDEALIQAEQSHLHGMFEGAFDDSYEPSVRRLLAELSRAGTSVRVHNFLVNLLAGLIAYTHQPKKPALSISRNILPAHVVA